MRIVARDFHARIFSFSGGVKGSMHALFIHVTEASSFISDDRNLITRWPFVFIQKG